MKKKQGLKQNFIILAVVILVGLLLEAALSYLYFGASSAPKKNISIKKFEDIVSYVKQKQAQKGRVTYRIYSQPVKYKGEDGHWFEIDTNFIKQGNKLVINKAPYRLLIDRSLNKPLNFSYQGTNLSLKLTSANSAVAQVSGNRVRYQKAYKNTEFERLASPYGLKQNYILKAPGHPAIFKEKIETNLKAKLDNDGQIVFLKGKEKILFSPRPVFFDANGKQGVARYQLSGDEITLILPSLVGFKYPIVVDPTIVASGSDDIEVNYYAGMYSANVSAASLQTHNTPNGESRIYVVFPTTSLQGQPISSASLYLYSDYGNNHPGPGPTVYHSSSFSTGASASVIWSTGVSNSIGVLVTPTSANGYYGIDVKDDLTEQVSQGYAYFQLRVPTQTADNVYYYKSADSSNKPYLEVTTTPPPTYTLTISASSNPTQSSMQVNWVAGTDTDIDGYRVYQGSHQVAETPSATAVGRTTAQATVNNLSANTSYQFHVHAYNAGGDGPTSSLSTAKYTLIQAPTLASSDFTPGTDNMAVSLAAYTLTNLSVGSSGAYFENTTAGQNSSWIQSTSWSSTILSSNTAYSFNVKTRNAEGVENSPSTFTRYTLANQPTQPVVTSVNPTTLHLTFGENGNNSSVTYSIEDTNSSTFVQANGSLGSSEVKQSFASWGGASGKDIVGLTPGARYVFRVIAYNVDNDSNASLSTTKYAPPQQPSAPSVSAVSNVSLRVTVNPNGNDSTVRYLIRETSTSGYLQADGTIGISEVWQTYTQWGGASGTNVTGLSANISYTFVIVAKNVDNETSTDSSSASRYTLPNAPQVSSLTAVSASSLNLKINENGNPSNITYAILEVGSGNYVQADGSLASSAVWQTYTNWGGASGKNVTGLSTNTRYQFKVKARSLDLDETALSVEVARYTLAQVPAQPAISGDYDETNGYHTDITINPVSNPTGTEFTVSDGGTNYVQADGSLSATPYWLTTFSLTNKNLAANTGYSYQVKAKNGDGAETAYSTAGTDTTPPAAPTGLTYDSLTYRSAKLQWSAVTAATSYQVSLGTNSQASNLGLETATLNTYFDKDGFYSGTTYYYKVRASNENGTGAYSSPGSFTTLGPSSPDPGNIALYKTNLEPIAVGSYVTDSAIKVKIGGMNSVYGGINAHRLTPLVEVKEGNQPFDGVVVSGSSANFVPGSPVDGWIDISGLQSGKSYHLRVRVKDEDLIPGGVESYWTEFYSGQNAFTVDYTAPSVSLTSPVTTKFYRGVIPVTGASSDNLGVTAVSFYLNSLANLIFDDNSSPWSFNFNSAGQNGRKTIYALGRDVAGNTATGQVAFKVDNYKPKTSTPYKAVVRRYRYTRLYYKVYDPYTASKAYITIKIKKGRVIKKVLYLGWKKINSLTYYTYRASLARGTYRFYIYARDQAGNTQYNTASNYLIIK